MLPVLSWRGSYFQEDMGNETKRRNRNETKRKTYEPKRTGTGKNRNEKKRKTTETKRNRTGKNREQKTTGTTGTGTETNRFIPETKRNETPTPRTGMNRKRNEPKPQEPKRNETKRYHPGMYECVRLARPVNHTNTTVSDPSEAQHPAHNSISAPRRLMMGRSSLSLFF